MSVRKSALRIQICNSGLPLFAWRWRWRFIIHLLANHEIVEAAQIEISILGPFAKRAAFQL